ncbi:MAG TPA: hypothetical protein VMT15_19745 [Bryobacteraceae bacterium]|nr:hypothetical protein [Bryobacteraceae bacterium]
MALRREFLLFPLIAAMVATPALAASGGEKVKEVNAKYVCFINKKHFDSPQKEVVVNGKKYYGCCDMCVKQLNEDAKSRMATDPVSGKEVDKADAKIGIDKAGNVYFFENEGNLKKFRVSSQTP